MKWVRCLNCGKRYPFEEIEKRLEQGEETPECQECHGILKTATISFGEAMPVRETREAERRSSNCDLFIAIGSSLVVYPAAYMPVYALEAGAKLVIINLTPTSIDHRATVVLRGKAGEVMSRVIERVKEKLKSQGGQDK